MNARIPTTSMSASKQIILDLSEEIIIDNFAGGGGTEEGIDMALGRPATVAINHDPLAIAMHRANHPSTRHYCESVWDVDPREVEPGRPIGLLWLSPACNHFSKAKGGKPVEKKIRGLAWVALRWIALRKPRVCMLENVEEFVTWGPLVMGADGKMRPCPKRKGREFNAFTNALRRHGYQVEYRELRACDYGAPTIRKRFFLIARRDGAPIVWPLPTHGDPNGEAVKSGRLQPWRTAAECIDWSLPCPSIFLTKEEGRAIRVNRPLAEATLRRIAKGVMKYVVNAVKPFIVPLTHQGDHRTYDLDDPFRTVTGAHRGELALVAPVITEHANASTQRSWTPTEPLRTQCAQVKGGHFALIAPHLTKFRANSIGSAGNEPVHTITAGGQTVRPAGAAHAMGVVTAFLAKHYGGVVGSDLANPIGTVTSVDHHSVVTAHMQRDFGSIVRHDADVPHGTITAGGGGKPTLVASNLVKLRGTSQDGQPTPEPLHTISAQGTHFAEVRAFLIKYYGTDQDPRLQEPLHTVTTKDRYGLVTVAGEDYAIVDIGLRMLSPRELFRAQGFPDSYIIDYGIGESGERIPLTKSAQVRMCGNSVCPPLAAALVGANVPELSIRRSRAA
jgi:DNA (cytosine-5)-methyltransferase 1